MASPDPEHIKEAKAELRVRAKRNRDALSIDHRRICDGLHHFLTSAPAGWVVTYSAMPGEPDLTELRGRAGIGPFAITRTPEEGRTLSVHSVDSPSETHRWGFEQPVADADIVADDEIAVVLVPGLAFDRRGGRLGFGAGYYDRFLSRLGPDTLAIAVSDGFIVDTVPTGEYDVAMTHLATEAGVVALPLS